MSNITGHNYVGPPYLTTPSYIMPHRESEEMTIYDVLRHMIDKTPWDGMDFNEENARKATATKLIDRLEEMNLLGKIAIDVKENI